MGLDELKKELSSKKIQWANKIIESEKEEDWMKSGVLNHQALLIDKDINLLESKIENLEKLL